MLSFIKRTCRYFKSKKAILQLYSAYVRSKLEYASIVWDPIYTNQVNQIERVQKKMLRFLYMKLEKKDAYKIPYDELLEWSGLESLSDRRSSGEIKYVSKLLKGIENNQTMLERMQFLVSNGRNTDTFYLPCPRVNIEFRAPAFTLCRAVNKSEIDIFK